MFERFAKEAGSTVLPSTAWMIALGLATVLLVMTQPVRIWRDRATAHRERSEADAAAAAR
jgi:hypothetical protein